MQPGHSASISSSIRQLKFKLEQSPCGLRFGGKNVHAGLAEIEKNSLCLAIVRQGNLNRSLHRNPVGTPAFTPQERGQGSQAGSGAYPR